MTKLEQLKREVSLDRYEADAHEVAEAMLRKLAPVGWGPLPEIGLDAAPIVSHDELVTLQRAA